MSTDVLDLVQRWSTAERGNDAAALQDVLSDDFAGVGPLGFVLDRPQWLVRFENGLTNTAFEVQEPRVREFGDAAVVIAVLDQQTHFGQQDSSGRYRLTLVATRSAGSWRLAHVHIGGLHNPADGPPKL